MIYEYLLLPSTTPSTGNGTSVANLLPEFHTYYPEDTNSNVFTLSVRTIDPWFGAQGPKTWRRRSTYHIRTGESLGASSTTHGEKQKHKRTRKRNVKNKGIDPHMHKPASGTHLS